MLPCKTAHTVALQNTTTCSNGHAHVYVVLRDERMLPASQFDDGAAWIGVDAADVDAVVVGRLQQHMVRERYLEHHQVDLQVRPAQQTAQ